MVEILLVYKKNFESVHDESLDYVTQTLTELISTHSINFDSRPRESVLRADFLGRDLVIVLGGDGTLTSISHNIDDSTPVMGVNSHPRDEDPEGSFGFYMDSNIHTFKQDMLNRILTVARDTFWERFTLQHIFMSEFRMPNATSSQNHLIPATARYT